MPEYIEMQDDSRVAPFVDEEGHTSRNDVFVVRFDLILPRDLGPTVEVVREIGALIESNERVLYWRTNVLVPDSVVPT